MARLGGFATPFKFPFSYCSALGARFLCGVRKSYFSDILARWALAVLSVLFDVFTASPRIRTAHGAIGLIQLMPGRLGFTSRCHAHPFLHIAYLPMVSDAYHDALRYNIYISMRSCCV